MYLNFYNMIHEPFLITPDPALLYLSPSHKEALASIVFGIEKRKGFVAITGEVGTGKTTIVKSYLERTDRAKVVPIYVFNSFISFRELLDVIFQELEIQPGNDSVNGKVMQLQSVLIEMYKNERIVVLIVDEAQNMPVDTLEQLRMLSNLETNKDKLLQILLVGQPELRDKLGIPELRQLRQRISIKAVIQPLSRKESLYYIRHRLAQVTLSEDPVFTPGALRKIVKNANGIPRLLNILCDNALIAGFGTKQKPITAKIVREVLADQNWGAGNARVFWKYAAACLALLVCGGVALSSRPALGELNRAVTGWFQAPAVEQAAPPETAGEPGTATETGPRGIADDGPSAAEPSPDAGREARVEESAPERSGRTPENEAAGAMAEKPVPETAADGDPDAPADHPAAEESPAGGADAAESRMETPAPVEAEPAGGTGTAPADAGTREAVSYEPPAAAANAVPPLVHRVVQGNSLAALCLRIYGKATPGVIETVRLRNPHIANPDLILVGDRIFFPPLGPEGSAPAGGAAE